MVYSVNLDCHWDKYVLNQFMLNSASRMMEMLHFILFFVLNTITTPVVCDEFIPGFAGPQENVKVCYGTRNGMSMSGTFEDWYGYLQRKYTNCTYVIGNLELTNIERASVPDVDLSFLATIEVVTGYVLIANVEADVIPFTSLRHIRGDETFTFRKTDNALAVLLSESRDGFHLPAIKEISGSVTFSYWASCYLDNIEWASFTKGTVTYEPWTKKIPYLGCSDSQCDPACVDTDGVSRCWGPGEDLCQSVNRMECHWFCRNGTCFEEGTMGCCHPECLGCYDGWIDTACEYCRHFRFQDKCVPACPRGTYAHIDTCYTRYELRLLDNNSSW